MHSHPTSLTFVLTNSACGGKGVRVACVDGAAGSGVDTTVSSAQQTSNGVVRFGDTLVVGNGMNRVNSTTTISLSGAINQASGIRKFFKFMYSVPLFASCGLFSFLCPPNLTRNITGCHIRVVMLPALVNG